MFWVLICTVHLTLCSYHATYVFQSEYTLYSCVNVKELIARSRRKIWCLTDCSFTLTQNHLICKKKTWPVGLTDQMISSCSEYLSVRCIWRYVIIASPMRMRVNPHSVVAWMSRKCLLDAGANITVKRIRDVITTCSQLHGTDMYSEHSSNIWSIWPNGWVFIYKLSGSGCESSSSHLNIRFDPCFDQGIPWHPGNYRVWIHCEMRTWQDENIQSNISWR